MSLIERQPQHTSPPYRSLILETRCATAHLSPETSIFGSSGTPQESKSFARMLTLHHRGSLKSKYTSLVHDVNKSLNKRMHLKPSQYSKLTITLLPADVLDRIFYFISDIHDLQACLTVNKLFYNCAKPYYYADIAFTSTYRLAQFVTYLRLNPSVGELVRLIDLSNLMLGIDEAQRRSISQPHIPLARLPTELARPIGENLDRHDSNLSAKGDDDDFDVSAGWRDWKLKGTPLYLFQHLSIRKHAISSLQNAAARKRQDAKSLKSLASFKSSMTARSIAKRSLKQILGPFHNLWARKNAHRFKQCPPPRSPPEVLQLSRTFSEDHRAKNTTSLLHPVSHKLLQSFSTTRDIPIGYAIHMVSLCPNLEELNLAGVNLSTDYVIDRSKASRFRTYDLMSHYPKNLASIINGITMRLPQFKHSTHLSLVDKLVNLAKSRPGYGWSQSSMATSFAPASSKMQYNSLLPPTESAAFDHSYLSDPASRVYLSDLSLKSINNTYLRKAHERQLLKCITDVHWEKAIRHNTNAELRDNMSGKCRGSLRRIDLLSMVWLNQSLARDFLMCLIDNWHLATHTSFSNNDSGTITSSADGAESLWLPAQDLVVDFSNSGMRKNLAWAQRIDMGASHGRELATRLAKGEPIEPSDRRMIEEGRRRGRVGENYTS